MVVVPATAPTARSPLLADADADVPTSTRGTLEFDVGATDVAALVDHGVPSMLSVSASLRTVRALITPVLVTNKRSPLSLTHPT